MFRPPANPVDRARWHDRARGLTIVGVAFIASLLLSYWAREASRPEPSEPPAPPTSSGIPGWPGAVDPARSVGAARELTKRPLLRGFVAEAVQSDGTIDFRKGAPSVRYTFQSPPGHGPQPAREPGTLPTRRYCGRQTVLISKKGIAAEPDRSDYPCAPRHAEPLPEPRCGLGDVWQRAIKRGIADGMPARIEYYRSKAGPAWRFEVPGTMQRFSLYGDCERVLEASEAIGSIP
jgi:hypothetical protein